VSIDRPELTTQDRDQDEEKDDGLDGGAQDLRLADRSVLVRFGQLGPGERGDKDGSDSHRSKPTGKRSFPERFDIRDPAVCDEHER